MKKTLILALALGFIGCRGYQVDYPPPGRKSRRVVLLSVDGLAAEQHQKMLTENLYRQGEGLAAFSSQGFASVALPPNPSLTAVAHATIATGHLPQDHGIVGNRFHVPGSPLGATTSGFDYPWQAKSLWETVRGQGGKVGVITFPGCDGSSPARSADFFMVYVNQPRSPARFLVLDAKEKRQGTWLFTFPVALALEGGQKEVAFSMFALEPAKAGDPWQLQVPTDKGDMATISLGEWFPLALRLAHSDGGEQTLGAWCLAKSVAGSPPRLLLYQGAFYGTEARPRAFRELVEREAGFWPGPPDDRHLWRGLHGDQGLSLEEYGQQLERFSRFFTKATLAAIRHMDFDLLLAYQPVVDEAQHTLTIADPRQPAFSQGLAATAAEFLIRTYRVVDGAVADLTRALELSRDTLVVVSDHGIHPVWAQINLQAWLNRQGFCSLQGAAPQLQFSGQCQLWAVSGGGVAHLYLNLAPGDPSGLQARAFADRLLLQASEELSRLEVAGRPVVEALASGERLAHWGLRHPHSGDLVVFPHPGIVFGGRLTDPLVSEPPYAGAHGFLNHHPSMAAVFLARGSGVKPGAGEKTNLTEVAPFVANLLGFRF